MRMKWRHTKATHQTYMDGCVTLTANNEENFFLVCLPATNTFATLTRAFVYFMILT